jgi:hypothetical protein
VFDIAQTPAVQALYINRGMPGLRCKKCDELWGRYTAATTRQVELLREKEAIAGFDTKRALVLDLLIEGSGATRNSVQTAIQTHLEADHADEIAPRVMNAAG